GDGDDIDSRRQKPLKLHARDVSVRAAGGVLEGHKRRLEALRQSAQQPVRTDASAGDEWKRRPPGAEQEPWSLLTCRFHNGCKLSGQRQGNNTCSSSETQSSAVWSEASILGSSCSSFRKTTAAAVNLCSACTAPAPYFSSRKATTGCSSRPSRYARRARGRSHGIPRPALA